MLDLTRLVVLLVVRHCIAALIVGEILGKFEFEFESDKAFQPKLVFLLH